MDNCSRLTGLFCEKNTDLVITKCNNTYLKYANVKSDNQILGLTDYELPWADNADVYQKHDLDALYGNHYSTIIPQRLLLGTNKISTDLLILHTKFQKRDATGKVIGISVRAVEIINQDSTALINLLTRKSPAEKNSFYLGKKHTAIKLSKRQSEILFYLSMRKTNKSIAKILNLSVRTIEYYIEIIKNKYQCRTRWELIDLAIQQGHGQTIPLYESANVLIRKINVE